ncbi:hypothetical protein [Mycobacterium deserti]|uniref:hypothetical protein n=1 Tax=Mycobacterium deserti TaxID=2978347 RepID=UPI0036F42275
MPTLNLTDQQLCARAFERHWQPSMMNHRRLNDFVRRIDVAVSSQQHRSTPSTHGQHPRAIEPSPVLFQQVDHPVENGDERRQRMYRSLIVSQRYLEEAQGGDRPLGQSV